MSNPKKRRMSKTEAAAWKTVDDLQNQILQLKDYQWMHERDRPWLAKAQEMLDSGRWAGLTLMQALTTELEETRSKCERLNADVTELNARMTQEVSSYLKTMEALRAENRELARRCANAS